MRAEATVWSKDHENVARAETGYPSDRRPGAAGHSAAADASAESISQTIPQANIIRAN